MNALCRNRAKRVAASHAEMVAHACRVIEASPAPPALAELAHRVGASPSRLHRAFKAATGLTPKAYADACRRRRLHTRLSTRRGSITDAFYDAGYNSSSRFYATAAQSLGMRARKFRDGGAGASIRFALGQCSLGAILVAQSGKGICSILLGDDPEQLIRDLQHQFHRAHLIGGDADFERVVAAVITLVEAPAAGLKLPLDIRGTAFQQRVWQALRAIPPGTTASYSEIARRIGAPRSTRAVAQACGANALAVAIPCHRVIRVDGGPGGYRWGLDRKRELLRRERNA